MSLLSMIKPNGPSGFGYGSTAEDVTEGIDLTGKTYVLTGCNSGIGFETMRVLTLRGATVLALARTVEKAKAAGAKTGGETIPVACELSEPDSVRAAIASIRALDRPLDGILCNAGIMALPKLTLQHGYDLQFFTNHVGHFILVTGLTDLLSDEGRVVMTSSAAHKNAPKGGVQLDNLDGSKSYGGWANYGQSKLSNILFSRELSKRLKPGQTANSVHPGVIATNLGRHMFGAATATAIVSPIFLKNIPQGAATQTWAAVSPGAAQYSGEYLKDCNLGQSNKYGQDDQLAKDLWAKTDEIVAGLE